MTLAAAVEAAAHFAPRPRIRSADWFLGNIHDHDGKPYDAGRFPHITAPGGPCDALDEPGKLSIWLQWASRLGKTFFGQSAQQFFAATNPGPMMFASSDQKVALEVVARTYGMLSHCPALKGQLRPPRQRRQDRILLSHCRCHVAWARSVSTLADKDVRWGHANEIDKWEHKGAASEKATEGDPLKLFDDRGKNFPSRKFIKESTPTVKGKSRVERGRLASTNCTFWVPCPHCERYQSLKFPRIIYDKLENGRHDASLARSTAHYACEHCEGKILDHHRGPMMRAGVWVPEGCTVDDAKARAAAERWAQVGVNVKGGDGAEIIWRGWRNADWIVGRPMRDDRDAGYQLSSLYALSLSWGDVAAEFVNCKDKPQDLRNFVNQWLAETWEVVRHKQTWEQLGQRLITNDEPQFRVPEWASLVTVGVDKQHDHYVYVVDAWGEGYRSATIHYGDEIETLEALRQAVLERTYPHADGGSPLRPSMTLIDSGYKPEGVYEFCVQCYRSQLPVWPCKGSSTALNTAYRVSKLGENTSMPGMQLVFVDTITTQSWIERQLHTAERDGPGGMSLFAGSLVSHQDFLEQLLNDAATDDLDSTNNVRESWGRIDTNIPNDFRAARRYSYIAALLATRGAAIRPRQAPVEKQLAPVRGGSTRPDGRKWV